MPTINQFKSGRGPVTRLSALGQLAVALLFASSCAVLPRAWFEGDGHVLTTETATCRNLTPESQLHPVGACEEAGLYRIQAGDRVFEYEKAVFQRATSALVAAFAEGSEYPRAELRGAQVDIWLAAPVFRPENADLIMVVRGRRGAVAWHLPLEMRAWDLGPGRVLWLGSEEFPTRRMSHADLLVLSPQPQIAAEDFERWLTGHLRRGQPADGAGVLAEASLERVWPVAELRTRPLAGVRLARLLARQEDAQRYIRDVRFSPAGEREGYKARVFSFRLN